jgi:hypothetical protein
MKKQNANLAAVIANHPFLSVPYRRDLSFRIENGEAAAISVGKRERARLNRWRRKQTLLAGV